MQCHQFEITGTGTDLPDPETLVGFPGAYKATDPGLQINIYWPPSKSCGNAATAAYKAQ
jgi:hypothetical protein